MTIILPFSGNVDKFDNTEHKHSPLHPLNHQWQLCMSGQHAENLNWTSYEIWSKLDCSVLLWKRFMKTFSFSTINSNQTSYWLTDIHTGHGCWLLEVTYMVHDHKDGSKLNKITITATGSNLDEKPLSTRQRNFALFAGIDGSSPK